MLLSAVGFFLEHTNLYLKSIAQTQKGALSDLQAGLLCPVVKIIFFKAQPQVAAGVAHPVLIVGAEFDQKQTALLRSSPAQSRKVLAGEEI